MKWRGILSLFFSEASAWVPTMAGGGLDNNENWFGVFGGFDEVLTFGLHVFGRTICIPIFMIL